MRKTAAKTGLGIAVLAAIVGFGLLAHLAPSAYEVVDKGPYVRDYAPEPGSVYELRFFDAVTVYGDDESRPSTDDASGVALVALATAALMTFLLLRASGAPPRLRRFHAVAALGAAYLAADELMAIHETIGHNLPFLADLPGVAHPDDVIIALYLLPALAFVYGFRDILASSVRSRALFGAGIALFACAAGADLADIAADELLEVLAAASLAAGFASLIALHLESRLRTAAAEPD